MSECRLSELSETLIGSEIVKLGGIIRERIKAGDQIYNYTIGDFDPSLFPIPTLLKEEICNAYEQGFTSYPASEGELDLRKAVGSFLKAKQGLDYDDSEILIAAGGRPLIYTAYRAIVDKGEKVIYPVPSWNNNHYTHFNEGEHVMIEAGKENNFMPTADQIRPHVKGAALIAVCSPLNPTGTTFKKEELEAICDLVLEENASRRPGAKKLYLLYDQIYWTLTFGETKHHDPVSLRPEMKKYTVYIDGISKAFAATGVRVGWSMGPAEVINKMKAINSHIGAWAPLAEQKATARFLSDHSAVDAYLASFKSELSFRLNEIYIGFKALQAKGFPVDAIEPQAAIYLTVRIDNPSEKDRAAITDFILREAKIALVPFHCFGANADSNWYRLSVGTVKKEEIPVMLQSLENALERAGTRRSEMNAA